MQPGPRELSLCALRLLQGDMHRRLRLLGCILRRRVVPILQSGAQQLHGPFIPGRMWRQSRPMREQSCGACPGLPLAWRCPSVHLDGGGLQQSAGRLAARRRPAPLSLPLGDWARGGGSPRAPVPGRDGADGQVSTDFGGRSHQSSGPPFLRRGRHPAFGTAIRTGVCSPNIGMTRARMCRCVPPCPVSTAIVRCRCWRLRASPF